MKDDRTSCFTTIIKHPVERLYCFRYFSVLRKCNTFKAKILFQNQYGFPNELIKIKTFPSLSHQSIASLEPIFSCSINYNFSFILFRFQFSQLFQGYAYFISCAISYTLRHCLFCFISVIESLLFCTIINSLRTYVRTFKLKRFLKK
jgi:hypothetical protein